MSAVNKTTVIIEWRTQLSHSARLPSHFEFIQVKLNDNASLDPNPFTSNCLNEIIQIDLSLFANVMKFAN